MSESAKREAFGIFLLRTTLGVLALSVAACGMGVTIALTYGAHAAGSAAGKATSMVKAEQIAGRWSGNHYGYGDIHAKCAGKPCTLTLDISACPGGWCGVLVKDDGACGARGMKVEAAEGKESWLRFDGKLEIEPKAASYVIQATLWGEKDQATAPAHLDIVGDTGPDLMFMRRSFPFQAHLARTGEAQCSSEKATS